MDYFFDRLRILRERLSLLFFFNDTATTEIYTLSLHDALPIWAEQPGANVGAEFAAWQPFLEDGGLACRGRLYAPDRKSTRLNSSHLVISYAVFCLKKKNQRHDPPTQCLLLAYAALSVRSPAPT